MNELINFLQTDDNSYVILLDDVKQNINDNSKFNKLFNHYCSSMDIDEFLWICEDDYKEPCVQKLLKSINLKSIKNTKYLKEFLKILMNVKSSNMLPFFMFNKRTFLYN
jgi:hypothetical protein